MPRRGVRLAAARSSSPTTVAWLPGTTSARVTGSPYVSQPKGRFSSRSLTLVKPSLWRRRASSADMRGRSPRGLSRPGFDCTLYSIQDRGPASAIIFSATLETRRLVYQEYHSYLAMHMAVTVHQGAAPPLDALSVRIRKDPEITKPDTHMLKYLVVNEVTEALFSGLDELDDR